MGAKPGVGGKGLREMLSGGVKALVVAGDNPVMLAADSDAVKAALEALDCLIVIDSLQTDTARLASVAFAEVTNFGRDGSYTNADRRLLRLARAQEPSQDQRDALTVLDALATGLAGVLGKTWESLPDAAAVGAEIAATVTGYAALAADFESGSARVLPSQTSEARVQAVAAPALATDDGRLLLTTSRSLYTSRDAAAIHSPEADKLHREEFLELNPSDAAALGIGQNRPVLVRNGSHELTLSAALTDAVAPGSAYLPLYYDGGLVNRLLPADGSLTTVSVRPA
jgi:predicted molibdopterin-dependent oxidoreductase YjgC